MKMILIIEYVMSSINCFGRGHVGGTILLWFSIIIISCSCYPFKALATKGIQDIIYVDCVTGVDKSGCGTDTSPCKSLLYSSPLIDGGQDAAKPDIMYLKGTCPVAGSSSYNAPTIMPSASYVKYTTWPGQPQAFIDGGESPTGTVIGATKWGITDITLENLQINGEVVFRGITNLLITDCALWGGGTKDPGLGDWCDVLFTEDCPNGRVQNNKIHDANGACGVGQLYTHYGRTSGDVPENFIIEHNTFYVSPGMKSSNGVFLKDNPESIYVRNNIFRNFVSGVKTSNQPETGHNVNINNNIFIDCGNSDLESGAVQLMIEVSGVNIYNNTFVNSKYADIGNKWGLVAFGAWNNIHYSNAPFIRMSYGSTVNSLITYLNYNSYYSPAGIPVWAETKVYNNITSWKGFLSGINKPNITENNSTYGIQSLSNFAGTDAASFRLTAKTPQNIIDGGRNSDGYAKYIGAWNPNEAMWIGYCDKGLDLCNINGNASHIVPVINSIIISPPTL